MNTPKVLLVLFGLLFFALNGLAFAGAAPQTFLVIQTSASFPEISFYLKVAGADGSPVEGLPGAEFSATVDGVEAKTPALPRFSETSEGVAYLVLFDVSGTMRGEQMNIAREGLKQMIEGLRPPDRMALISFGDKVTTLADFTGDKALLNQQADALQPVEQQTRLYAALDAAQGIAAQTQGADLPQRRLIVVISDGKDEGSGFEPDDLLQKKWSSTCVPIYSLGLAASATAKSLEILNRFSANTHGEYQVIKQLKDFGKALTSIQASVTSEFIAKVEFSSIPPDNQRHPARVALAVPGKVLTDETHVFLGKMQNVPPPAEESAPAPAEPVLGNDGSSAESPAPETPPGPSSETPAPNASGEKPAPAPEETQAPKAGEESAKESAVESSSGKEETAGPALAWRQLIADRFFALPARLKAAAGAAIALFAILVVMILLFVVRMRSGRGMQGAPAYSEDSEFSYDRKAVGVPETHRSEGLLATGPGIPPTAPQNIPGTAARGRFEAQPQGSHGDTRVIGVNSARGGATPAPAVYKLNLAIRHGQGQRDTIPVIVGEASVRAGSDSRCEVVIQDPQVAPVHFELRVQAGKLTLINPGGANKISVNRNPVFQQVFLGGGDIIQCGASDIRVSF